VKRPREEAANVDGSRQRAVLVLGAGRSGTSIITRAVQAVGVDLGDDFKAPSRKNPTGFFEDAELLRLSKKLRRKLGLRPDSVRLVDDDVWTGPIVMPFYKMFADSINTRFGHAALWGFKYGRTMRLLPFWVRLFKEMDISPSYVMAVRNPLSVARSRKKLDAGRGQQEHSDLEWLVNVVPYFDRIRGEKLVVINYDALMENPAAQLERLAAGLELPVTGQMRQDIDAFANVLLDRGLQHTRFSIEDLKAAKNINVLVRDAYYWLDALSYDEVRPAAAALWDAWKKINSGVSALGPILARIDTLNHELRVAQWNPFSPLPAAWKAMLRFWRH